MKKHFFILAVICLGLLGCKSLNISEPDTRKTTEQMIEQISEPTTEQMAEPITELSAEQETTRFSNIIDKAGKRLYEVYDGDELISEYEWDYFHFDNGTQIGASSILVTQIQSKTEKVELSYDYDIDHGYPFVKSIRVDGVPFEYNISKYFFESGFHYVYTGFYYNGDEYDFLCGEDLSYITGIALNGELIAYYTYYDSDGERAFGVYKKNEEGDWELNEDPEFIGNKNKIRSSWVGWIVDDTTGLTYDAGNRDRFATDFGYGVCPEVENGIADISTLNITFRNKKDFILTEINPGKKVEPNF